MNTSFAHAAWAFWRTRRLAKALRTRADVLRWRKARLTGFLRSRIARAAFYERLAGADLEDLPIVDKSVLLAQFERFNIRGVTLDEARAAVDRGEERVGGLIVGQSTGTSGNRGVFVISEAERFTWLGVMLAKTLPDFLTTRPRVALALPGYSRLYASAAETGRLALRFFDLALGVDRWRDGIRAFAPDTIVAPPKVLRRLAEDGAIRPRNVFSGAEVLDPLDRAIIERTFGVPVREIYMATEGLLGVACAHGVLHLAEDVVAFEWEPAPGSAELLKPIITDFTRLTQIMARYRMNDLLRLRPAACACGSPLRAVAAVEGRQDDVFMLVARHSEGLVFVTPDVIRNAVVDADWRIKDFRAVQTAADQIELSLDPALGEDAASAAVASLTQALARIGASAVTIRARAGLEVPMDRKLRRVMRLWKDPEQGASKAGW